MRKYFTVQGCLFRFEVARKGVGSNHFRNVAPFFNVDRPPSESATCRAYVCLSFSLRCCSGWQLLPVLLSIFATQCVNVGVKTNFEPTRDSFLLSSVGFSLV